MSAKTHDIDRKKMLANWTKRNKNIGIEGSSGTFVALCFSTFPTQVAREDIVSKPSNIISRRIEDKFGIKLDITRWAVNIDGSSSTRTPAL
jgi:hypothetical protein